eukprot:3790505-Pyramimonas_sp.AAC.1
MSGGRMRTPPLGPSVELTVRPRTVSGACRHGRGDACGRGHWSLRWNSLWGHETYDRCAEMSGGTRANTATGAVRGAPCEATSRVRGVPTCVAGTHANTATVAFFVELPMRPRN